MPAILDRILKKPGIPVPPTTLLLTVETNIIPVPTKEPDMYKLFTIKKADPKIVLQATKGKTQGVNYWNWRIGCVWYDFEREFWCVSLSMNASIFDENGKCVAVGFNGDECHVATYYGFAGNERIRYSRIGYGFYEDEPYVFYPEIRVRIRNREAETRR